MGSSTGSEVRLLGRSPGTNRKDAMSKDAKPKPKDGNEPNIIIGEPDAQRAQRTLLEQINAWHREAEKQTPKTLGPWMKQILHGAHEGQLKIHAHAVIALGALFAAKGADPSGLDEVEAHSVTLEITRLGLGIQSGFRIQPFTELLNPNAAGLFAGIPEPIFLGIQAQARRKMLSAPTDTPPQVIAHWKQIADGRPPFGLKIVKVGRPQ